MKLILVDKGVCKAVLPETAIVRPGMPFFMPDWATGWKLKAHVGVVIERLGKAIHEKFTGRYWSKSVLALKAEPIGSLDGIEIPEGFDGSLLISSPVAIPSVLNTLEETLPHEGRASEILSINDSKFEITAEAIAEAISVSSLFFTLHTGDIVLMPLENVPTVEAHYNTRIKISCEGEVILNHKIK